LIRHAATENNRAVPPVLQGRRTDPPLSPEGWQQARRTARFLADVPLAAVYASPLLRARQTATEIAAARQLDVQTIDALIEADVGIWEGRSWEDIQKSDPEAYQAFMRDPAVHPYLGGENMLAVRDRVVPAFEQLMAENLGRRIAVVAHNVVNRVYLAELIGLDICRFRSVPQDNCAVNLLRFRHGRAKAVTINGIFHLAEEP